MKPDTENLPPLPEPDIFYEDGKNEWGYTDLGSAYSANAVRQAQREAIAAERRKQAALQSIDAGQDIEASGEQDECLMCNGSGIVGFPPDQYEECPDCIAAREAGHAPSHQSPGKEES